MMIYFFDNFNSIVQSKHSFTTFHMLILKYVYEIIIETNVTSF